MTIWKQMGKNYTLFRQIYMALRIDDTPSSYTIYFGLLCVYIVYSWFRCVRYGIYTCENDGMHDE